MRAVVLKGFGGLEMLEERDLPVPEPGPGEVLVRNLAVAVNPVDAKIRAAGRWAGVEPPFVLGYDAAGVVAKVGPGVKDLKEGDEVYYTPEIFGNPHGTYAEYTPVPAGIVAKKPKNLSFAEAAAIPLAGGTAWEAVVRRLAVRPGETVLVMGGAGGVGSFAVQFAKAALLYPFPRPLVPPSLLAAAQELRAAEIPDEARILAGEILATQVFDLTAIAAAREFLPTP